MTDEIIALFKNTGAAILSGIAIANALRGRGHVTVPEDIASALKTLVADERLIHFGFNEYRYPWSLRDGVPSTPT